MVEINPWRRAAGAARCNHKLSVIREVELESAITKAPYSNISKPLIKFDELATAMCGQFITKAFITMATQ